MSEELKACPFCGGEALLERGSDHHGKWFNLGCSRHWGAVADPDESCIGGRLFYTETEKDEAEAITAWNTRATNAENQRLRAEVEALREALEEYVFLYAWKAEGMHTEQARIHAKASMVRAARTRMEPQ